MSLTICGDWLLPVPPLCEPSSIWASFASLLVFGTAEPNIAWNVPNTPLILGVTLVFQAFAVQPANCWRATDALHVRFQGWRGKRRPCA